MFSATNDCQPPAGTPPRRGWVTNNAASRHGITFSSAKSTGLRRFDQEVYQVPCRAPPGISIFAATNNHFDLRYGDCRLPDAAARTLRRRLAFVHFFLLVVEFSPVLPLRHLEHDRAVAAFRRALRACAPFTCEQNNTAQLRAWAKI